MQIQGLFEGWQGWVSENVRGEGIGLKLLEGSEDGALEGHGIGLMGEGK